jgi:hypothetical protein
VTREKCVRNRVKELIPRMDFFNRAEKVAGATNKLSPLHNPKRLQPVTDCHRCLWNLYEPLRTSSAEFR